MLEHFKNAPWGDILIIMSKGSPPLALQFLLINFAFFVIYAVRRMRGKTSRQNTLSYLAHGLMILVNVTILYQGDLLPMYQTYIITFWRHFQQVI